MSIVYLEAGEHKELVKKIAQFEGATGMEIISVSHVRNYTGAWHAIIITKNVGVSQDEYKEMKKAIQELGLDWQYVDEYNSVIAEEPIINK